MTKHQFIFSKKSPECYYRHVAFWFMVYLFFLFPKGFSLLLYNDLSIETLYPDIEVFMIFLLMLTVFMLTVYPLVYQVVPRFGRQKNKTKIYFRVIGIFILSYLMTALVALLCFEPNKGENSILLFVFGHTIGFFTTGPPVFSMLFLTTKMLKNYVLKMEEKITLEKENANAELQLLKAQVHPHFLFNTLNNIYSFNLNKSPQAAGLVLKLSDTLTYMVNDCKAELVPLKKEIKMLQDYIGLEKVRYGKRLKMDVEINGNFGDKLIAPLLLIPFVENSFKHGSSKMLEHPWIKIEIDIQVDLLNFSISNSKPDETHSSLHGLNGIGLVNVQKRLQLLYPGQHTLEIDSDEHSFLVRLKLPLHMEKSESLTVDTSGLVFTETYATT